MRGKMLIHHLPILQKVADFLTLKAAPPLRPRDPNMPKDILTVKNIPRKAIQESSKTEDPRAVKRRKEQEHQMNDQDPNIDIAA